jgi:phenylacetyl-CoA:acceptor oxidoreductase subunit 2
VPLILTTGICEGAGLFLAASALVSPLAAMRPTAAAGLAVLAALRGVVWRAYLDSLESGGAPIRTLEVLRAFELWFLLSGVLAPIVLIAAAFMVPGADAPLFVLAGSSAFAAGWALKFILITRAAYNQGFALAHVPVRGSGAPGPSVKPGWAMQ